jgi:hypothetical protein
MFYPTTKRIARSSLNRGRKLLTISVLGLSLAFGILSHIFQAYGIRLWPRSCPYGVVILPVPGPVITCDDYGHLVAKLLSFTVIFAGWTVSQFLVLSPALYTKV